MPAGGGQLFLYPGAADAAGAGRGDARPVQSDDGHVRGPGLPRRALRLHLAGRAHLLEAAGRGRCRHHRDERCRGLDDEPGALRALRLPSPAAGGRGHQGPAHGLPQAARVAAVRAVGPDLRALGRAHQRRLRRHERDRRQHRVAIRQPHAAPDEPVHLLHRRLRGAARLVHRRRHPRRVHPTG